MNENIHLMLATTFSMISTFGFHCIMSPLTSRNSINQIIWFDFPRDLILVVRCLFYESRSEEMCVYLINPNNCIISYIIVLMIFSTSIVSWLYGLKMIRYMLTILFVLITVEYVARWINDLDVYYQIDLITVCLFIWQPIALVLHWMWHDLESPIMLLEQGSLCVLFAFKAFIYHNIIFRYVPIEINLVLFWTIGALDIFLCLHHRDYRGVSSSHDQTLNSKHDDSSMFYYVGGANGERNGGALGLADFLVYDILLLLVLSQHLSLAIKILMTIGCIISIQIGYFVTIVIFEMMWKLDEVPAFPLPIITFSIYILILNGITSLSNQCVQLF